MEYEEVLVYLEVELEATLKEIDELRKTSKKMNKEIDMKNLQLLEV